MLKVFTDGGSRGNPGESACACVFWQNQEIVFEEAKYLGKKTNNEAEYQGVILALSAIETQFPQEKEFAFYLDSKLVVEQLSGNWKIKDPKIIVLAGKCCEEIRKLKLNATFTHVPREKNKEADLLVNQKLDAEIMR